MKTTTNAITDHAGHPAEDEETALMAPPSSDRQSMAHTSSSPGAYSVFGSTYPGIGVETLAASVTDEPCVASWDAPNPASGRRT